MGLLELLALSKISPHVSQWRVVIKLGGLRILGWLFMYMRSRCPTGSKGTGCLAPASFSVTNGTQTEASQHHVDVDVDFP